MGVAERRQREKHERRCCILDAAERVFLKHGLAAATMDQIAQEAEVSKGTLYLYFKGKDELYLTIALRALGELAKLFDEVAAQGGTGLERVERLLRAHQRFAVENPDRFRIATSWINTDYSVSDESPQFDEYKQLVARLFARGFEAIELGKQDGSLRSDLEPSRVAVQLWGATLGVLMLQVNAPEVRRRFPPLIDVGALASSFVDLAVHAIRAPR
jgi:AcrR family transcriptional regulator